MVILITGITSGFGRAMAARLNSDGHKVYGTYRRDSNQIPGVTYLKADVQNEESLKSAVNHIIEHEGRIDTVISNAGMGIGGPLEFTSIDDAQRQMDVNFMGAVRLTQAVLPQLRQQRFGRIIYTSSVAAILAVPYQSFYSASKAAINAMALALANEVKEFGISVSVMMPGDVSTGFTDARRKSTAGEDVYIGANKAITTMEHDERSGMSPRQMAKLFYHIATCRSPRPQYVGGFSYRILCFLERLLPKRLVNWIEYKVYS